jgi:hypothetical protein
MGPCTRTGLEAELEVGLLIGSEDDDRVVGLDSVVEGAIVAT